MRSKLLIVIKRKSILFTLLAVLTFSVTSCGILASMFGKTYVDYYQTAFCYKGQWSNWEKTYLDGSNISYICSPEKHIIGISLWDNGFRYWSFEINNYSKGQKTFTGTVEYYVNDTYPTAEAQARCNRFLKPNFRYDKTPTVKRTAKATIKIVNNEKKPSVYNIWYDNIGVGISIRDLKY